MTSDMTWSPHLRHLHFIIETWNEIEAWWELKLFRLLRLGRIWRFLEHMEFANYWRIARLFLSYCVVAHWVACCLAFLARHNNVESAAISHWSIELGLLNSNNRHAYLLCMHAAMGFLLRGGPQPHTDLEILFSILSMLLGAGMYATLFGQVALLIQVNHLYFFFIFLYFYWDLTLFIFFSECQLERL